jgi:hypothetical protein
MGAAAGENDTGGVPAHPVRHIRFDQGRWQVSGLAVHGGLRAFPVDFHIQPVACCAPLTAYRSGGCRGLRLLHSPAAESGTAFPFHRGSIG